MKQKQPDIEFGSGKCNITRHFFLKNHAEYETGRLVPDFFLFFKKALYEVKASVYCKCLLTRL